MSETPPQPQHVLPSGVLDRVGSGDPRIVVAVLDGPIDLQHPCFAGASVRQSEGLTPSGHGTHVASVLFGQPGTSVEGVAPGCTGVSVPIFTKAGDRIQPATQAGLAQAIDTARSQGAHVISISAGELQSSTQPVPRLVAALDACEQAGVLVVAAVGNEGCECNHVPAAYPTVLAVGAVNESGEPVRFSNWGAGYEGHGVVAPGSGIQVAAVGGATVPFSGTSAATPYVAGVAALLLSAQLQAGQDVQPLAVRQALLDTAVGCSGSQACDRLMVGRIDPQAALDAVLGQAVQAAAAPEPAAEGPAPDPRPEPAAQETPAVLAAGASEAATQASSQAPAPVNAEDGATDTPPAAEPPDRPAVTPAAAPALVYAIGAVAFEYSSEARRDSFAAAGVSDPDDATQLLAHLASAPWATTAVTWLLTQDGVPVYAVRPALSYAKLGYAWLQQTLAQQTRGDLELSAVAGQIVGSVSLRSGQVVPVLLPKLRGAHRWSWPTCQSDEALRGFLARVAYELRNPGRSEADRALNFAATQAHDVDALFAAATAKGQSLAGIAVERSPICRPGSDCWDVRLTFFTPSARHQQAREVSRFTVDVSDVVPVRVGPVRTWHEY